jgi:hypothetical protein
MAPDEYGVKPGSHIPGAVVHEYLCRFAERYELHSRLRLQSKVERAELMADHRWSLTVRHVSSKIVSSVIAAKLVIATGMTSEPNIPTFPGQETFTGNFLHSRQLRDRAEDIRQSREVVVIGANKSAWDACYSAATSGAHVTMVIRPGGGGPSWVWPVLLPLGLTLQKMANVRFFTLFEPCIWAEKTSGYRWIRRFLHRTRVGRQIVKLFWTLLAAIVASMNGYSTHPELVKLKPWTSMYWMSNALSVHNYDTNWFDLVKQGKISVEIAEITALDSHKAALSNGKVLLADTLICCTGWKPAPPVKFLPEGIEAEIGLPGNSEVAEDKELVEIAKEVDRSIPGLRCGPRRRLLLGEAAVLSKRTSQRSQPFRLYRFMIPASANFLTQRNLAFIGAHLALNATTVCQTQALWITAFFQNKIAHLSEAKTDAKQVRHQTLLHSEFCRVRRPPDGAGVGERCPDLVFDGFLYTDLLLRDLGLAHFRKQSAWQELFGRYWPSDYAGLTDSLRDRVVSDSG